MTTQGAALGALSVATILGAQPYGISIETVMIGTAFSIVGVIGRAAFEMQKASEAPGGMKFGSIAGWMGAGLIGAPFITILYLVVLKLSNVQSDNIAIIGLMFFGFSGPRLLIWLLNLAIGILNKRTGLAIPLFGPTPDGKTP